MLSSPAARGAVMALAVYSCSTVAEAALGVPENIILYRDPTIVGGTGPTNAFVQDRNVAHNFSTDGQFIVSAVGGNGDALEVGDINGDGIDDIMAVQFGGPVISTVGAFTQPGPPLVFPGPGIINTDPAAGAQRLNGTTATDTIFTRRDFDGDGLADTVGVINELLGTFNADSYSWGVQLAVDSIGNTAPLNQSGEFPPVGSAFGQPDQWGAIPLVGDFNGDGILDRMVHETASIVTGGGSTGRVPRIDLSLSFGGINSFGDANFDNAPQIIALNDTDEVQAADIDGDGLDDLVVIRPDAAGEQYQLEGWINTGTFAGPALGGEPTFVFDPNFSTLAGFINLGDTIAFGTFPQLVPINGDYNADGVVNAADYTVARDNFGEMGTLNGEDPLATTRGDVDQEDVAYWASRYGATTNSAVAVATPEPAGALVALLGVGFGLLAPRRV